MVVKETTNLKKRGRKIAKKDEIKLQIEKRNNFSPLSLQNIVISFFSKDTKKMHLNLSGLLLCIGVNAINVFGFFLGARIGVNTC